MDWYNKIGHKVKFAVRERMKEDKVDEIIE